MTSSPTETRVRVTFRVTCEHGVGRDWGDREQAARFLVASAGLAHNAAMTGPCTYSLAKVTTTTVTERLGGGT